MDVDAEAAEASGGVAATDDFPFVDKVLGVASMEPNDCTGRESFMAGGCAVEVEMGGDGLSFTEPLTVPKLIGLPEWWFEKRRCGNVKRCTYLA